jgi:hypothetical protein
VADEVWVNGVEYVPKASIPELMDKSLESALKQLVSMQYFRIEHKAIPQAWDVLNALAPELAQLAADDPRAAYVRMHGSED